MKALKYLLYAGLSFAQNILFCSALYNLLKLGEKEGENA